MFRVLVSNRFILVQRAQHEIKCAVNYAILCFVRFAAAFFFSFFCFFDSLWLGWVAGGLAGWWRLAGGKPEESQSEEHTQQQVLTDPFRFIFFSANSLLALEGCRAPCHTHSPTPMQCSMMHSACGSCSGKDLHNKFSIVQQSSLPPCFLLALSPLPPILFAFMLSFFNEKLSVWCFVLGLRQYAEICHRQCTERKDCIVSISIPFTEKNIISHK